jgi:hypothetical protein
MEIRNSMTYGRSIAEAPPTYARILASCHVIFFIIGISASLYVYQTFVRSGAVSGRCSESFETFVFTFPAIQGALALVLTLQAIFWKTVVRIQAKREARYRQIYTGDPSGDGLPSFFPHPDVRNVDGVLAFKLAALGFLFFGAVLLGVTIYRCVLVASNQMCT